jgi:hypothetical protein
MAQQCPNRYDVRFMTLDESQEYVQQVLANQDAAEAAQRSEELPIPESDKEDEAGFASRSG